MGNVATAIFGGGEPNETSQQERRDAEDSTREMSGAKKASEGSSPKGKHRDNASSPTTAVHPNQKDIAQAINAKIEDLEQKEQQKAAREGSPPRGRSPPRGGSSPGGGSPGRAMVPASDGAAAAARQQAQLENALFAGANNEENRQLGLGGGGGVLPGDDDSKPGAGPGGVAEVLPKHSNLRPPPQRNYRQKM